jgi:hypothetical protein
MEFFRVFASIAVTGECVTTMLGRPETFQALAVLKRERRPRSICYQSLDANDLVTSLNGKTFFSEDCCCGSYRNTALAMHSRVGR